MSEELIIIERESALSAFVSDDGLSPFIDEIERLVNDFEHDTSTAIGRKKTASLANKVAKFKVYLDDLGKELVSDWKNKSKIVDATRKIARDRLDELKAIARKPLSDWENAEYARLSTLEAKVKAITDLRAKEYSISSDIKADIDSLVSLEIDDSFEEKKASAIIEKDNVLRFLNSSFERMNAFETQQAELERLRKEEEIRKAKERDEEIARQARIKAEQEAEAKILAEKARAENEKLEASKREEQAKRDLELAAERLENQKRAAELASIKAEQDAKERETRAKLDAEERIRKEQEQIAIEAQKREDNKKHVAEVRKAAKVAMVNIGIEESLAIKLILAIHNKEVPSISISY